MSRWPRGEAEIEQLIATNQLQRVVGGQANGAHLLERASRTLATGDGFRPFGVMRRRRHELEYPAGPGETTSADEAASAVADATRMYDAARQLFPSLAIF